MIDIRRTAPRRNPALSELKKNIGRVGKIGNLYLGRYGPLIEVNGFLNSGDKEIKR
jgi:hypothetical protein